MTNSTDLTILTSPIDYDKEIPVVEFPRFILDLIKHHDGNQIAFIDAETNQTVSYSDLLNRSSLLAASLQSKFNLKPKENVAVVLPNCTDYPSIVLAIQLCGAVATLINPSQTAGELLHSIHLTNPRLWFGTEKIIKNFEELNHAVKSTLILLGESKTDYIKFEHIIEEGRGKIFQSPIINPKEDPAFILFSSGTTGVPKGVALTHYNCVTARRQNIELAKDFAVDPEECSAAILPFYHTFGISTIFDNFIRGLRFVLFPKFTFTKMLEAIQNHKISILPIVPAIAVQLIKHPVEKHFNLSSLKIIMSGAAALSKESKEKLVEKFSCFVFQGYGMTEATLRTHTNNFTHSRDGSIGVVTPFCQSKIVDIESNKALGPNETGEICVRGPLIMKGYVGNSDATADIIDQEGWLHTGDVGHYDEDGFFYITDRKKELIKYKGYQVSPTELEQILLTHPGVEDVAIGPVSDEAAGEIPKAYVVRKPGSTVTEEDIITFLHGKVSAYKYLRGGVSFIDAVPKTHTGKILRRHLKIITSKL